MCVVKPPHAPAMSCADLVAGLGCRLSCGCRPRLAGICVSVSILGGFRAASGRRSCNVRPAPGRCSVAMPLERHGGAIGLGFAWAPQRAPRPRCSPLSGRCSCAARAALGGAARAVGGVVGVHPVVGAHLDSWRASRRRRKRRLGPDWMGEGDVRCGGDGMSVGKAPCRVTPSIIMALARHRRSAHPRLAGGSHGPAQAHADLVPGPPLGRARPRDTSTCDSVLNEAAVPAPRRKAMDRRWLGG